MEMKNNDSRFNLISFVSGGARRHPPLRSVFTLLFCICFSLFSSPLSASATAPIINPELQPIIDTDVVSFQESYLNLSPAAQAAGAILFGAYVTEYAGLADYGTVFQSMPTEGTVWDRLQFTGQQFIDTLMLPINMADQLVISPLIDLGKGIFNKVQNVTSVSDFINDISTSDNYGLPYSTDVGNSLNQVFAAQLGLYNWQYSESGFTSSYSWKTSSQASSFIEPNYNYCSSSDLPAVRVNSTNLDCYNAFVSRSGYLLYHICLINSNTGELYFYKDDGSYVSQSSLGTVYYQNSFSKAYTLVTSTINNKQQASGVNAHPFIAYTNFNTNYKYTSGSLSEFVQNMLDSPNGKLFYYYPQSYTVPLPLDWLDEFRYGTSLSDSVLITQTTDLGFLDSTSLQYLNPKKDAVFDIKGIVDDIVAAPEAANDPIPLKDIALQNTYVDNELIQAQDLQPTSFNITPPVSGVSIPDGLFSGLLDTGGFVSYLWYMTKPFVSFTGDLIDSLTFDGFDGADPVTGASVHFSGSGPGQIFIGVVCVGLIGGLVVKCLL